MGTKGSYSGSAAGGEVRDGLDDWLASLPGGDSTAPAPVGSQPTLLSPLRPSPNSPAGRILPTTALFRSSRSGGGNSRGRRSTDTLTRSVSGSARSAGRGAAAAYAYRTGDAQTLRNLGLDYDALRANPNVFDVAHQIAQKVCEDLPSGTIETAEQMEVVGRLAEWLVESETTGTDVTLGQIAEEAVALILAEAYLVETASTLLACRWHRNLQHFVGSAAGQAWPRAAGECGTVPSRRDGLRSRSFCSSARRQSQLDPA